ncbi:BrnT family toxin [Azospirillum rugosum]|nr:BrnT family toxin [Azospirillum rugosum]
MLIWEGPIVQNVDDRFDYGETRYIAFGEVDGRVLAVVYTWRGDCRRLISARMANRHERTSYRQAITGIASDDTH